MAIYKDITENECIYERHPFVKDNNLMLVLFSNMKLHTVFRLVSKLVTMNDPNWTA